LAVHPADDRVGGGGMIPTIALIVGLTLTLLYWLDWYTSRELDREIRKFFDDHEA